MSAVIFGTNGTIEVKIAGNYFPIGCFTNFSFRHNNELILKTDVNAGLFRKRRVRISDCSASVSGLTTLENDTTASTFYFLQESVRRIEQDIRFTFTDQDGVSKQIQGLFLLETGEVSGQVEDFSEFDLEFQGTGGFTISAVDESPEPLPGGLMWDYWETTPGDFAISGPGVYGRSFAGVDFDNLIEVDREGTQYDTTESAPGNRQAKYNGTSIEFENQFESVTPVERVYAIWQLNS
jgi:hypothetical protein